MTRPLRVGDRVTATGTVTMVDTSVKHISVRFDGTSAPNGFYSEDADSLTLITPAEPPVGSVVVKDGVAYTRFPSHGRRCWGAFGIDNEGAKYWDDISDGDVIFTPGGES